MLKAVLFDLDNTLIDWRNSWIDWETLEAPHVTGVYQYLCTVGKPSGNLETFKETYYARSRAAWESADHTLIAPHIGEVLVDAAVALDIPPGKVAKDACMEAYGWRGETDVSLFPEVPEVLTLLREKGIRLGIITNAYQPMWMRDMEIAPLGLLDYFPDCRLSAADVGYLKPHQRIFWHALECLEVQPQEAVFVGDSLTSDVAGAKTAGLRAVWRRVENNNFSSEQALPDVTPDATIHSLLELPPLLDSWFSGWRGQQ